MNQRNFGIVEGRLTKDPVIFTNSDGSRKVMLTVAARDNFRGNDGKHGTQFVNLEAFISKNQAGNGVYAYMHKGDMVGLHYTVRSNRYTKPGETEETFTQVLFVQEVDLKDGNKRAAAGDAADAAENAPEMPEGAAGAAEAAVPEATPKTGSRKGGRSKKGEKPEDAPFGA